MPSHPLSRCPGISSDDVPLPPLNEPSPLALSRLSGVGGNAIVWSTHYRGKGMGRSYWFECSKCGYRAKVSGRADRGLNLFVQTIRCQDCRELYDAVTRIRVPEEPGSSIGSAAAKPRRTRLLEAPRTPVPPSFQSALNRLLYMGARQYKWLQFKAQCPVSALHRIETWNEPNRCPRCNLPLERAALPYRIWD
jgi:hypothetical protein